MDIKIVVTGKTKQSLMKRSKSLPEKPLFLIISSDAWWLPTASVIAAVVELAS